MKQDDLSGLVGVLFDKDGTLIDFQQTWGPAVHAMIEAFAGGDRELVRAQAEALDFSHEEKRFMATSALVAGSTADYARLWGNALRRTDYDVLKHEIDALAAVESLKTLTPVCEMLELFASLRAMGLQLGIATNDSERSARGQIEALGLADLVDFVAGYDTGHGAKPDPGMVLAFARSMGADPRQIVMVGDSLPDLEAARSAGAVAVAVLSGLAERAELAPHADFVIEHVGDLPGLLVSIGGR